MNHHRMADNNKIYTAEEYKYFAFISYNSKDAAWGKRLQKKLEGYRMPATLCSEHGWQRTPLKPVFFAPSDIQPGGLNTELQERLKASRHLIVICSPNSAKSKWVGDEIAYFHSLGRTDNIHFFIVDGMPHSGNEETECFNPIVKTLGIPEILGANIHEKVYRWSWLNKERAYVQLITKLLGVEFDSIWQRHKRMLIRKVVAWVIGILTVIAALIGVGMANRSFSIEMSLLEASAPNANLPQMENAEVTLFLDNETKRESISQFNQPFTINNIPARYRNKEVRVTVEAVGYFSLDTIISMEKPVFLSLYRDDTFAKYHGRVFDEDNKPFPNVQVQILDLKTTTDGNGLYNIYIPIEQRHRTNTLILSKKGYERKVVENLLPGENNFIFD